METWPDVVFGGSHEPYVDRIVDEVPYITRPKTVAAYGTVQGYPWSVVVFAKRGDPENDEEIAPDYQPKSARFEFFLGGTKDLLASQPGGMGGGGGVVSLRKGAHIDTTAHCWETRPPLIGYVIFTSDGVQEIVVRPDGCQPRGFRVEQYLKGFPKFCVFFPPFDVPGTIEARDEHGGLVQRRGLFPPPLRRGTYGGGD